MDDTDSQEAIAEPKTNTIPDCFHGESDRMKKCPIKICGYHHLCSSGHFDSKGQK